MSTHLPIRDLSDARLSEAIRLGLRSGDESGAVEASECASVESLLARAGVQSRLEAKNQPSEGFEARLVAASVLAARTGLEDSGPIAFEPAAEQERARRASRPAMRRLLGIAAGLGIVAGAGVLTILMQPPGSTQPGPFAQNDPQIPTTQSVVAAAEAEAETLLAFADLLGSETAPAMTVSTSSSASGNAALPNPLTDDELMEILLEAMDAGNGSV